MRGHECWEVTFCVVCYLCSCSCCSKLRGVSLQKSWQLAGLLANTLAFGTKREMGTYNYHCSRLQTVSLLLHHFQMKSLNGNQSRLTSQVRTRYKTVWACGSLNITRTVDCTCSLWVRYCVSKLCLRDKRGGCGAPWYKARPSCCLHPSPFNQKHKALEQNAQGLWSCMPPPVSW